MFLRLLSFFFVLSLVVLPFDLGAQSSDQKVTYKKARALQTSTAKKIVKVVEALERVDEEGKEDPDYAPLKVFNIIGYATTATSTVEALPLKQTQTFLTHCFLYIG